MTLWCSICLGSHEVVRAVTVTKGEALCVRHFAGTVVNDAMTPTDIHEMVIREMESGVRFDELGKPLGLR